MTGNGTIACVAGATRGDWGENLSLITATSWSGTHLSAISDKSAEVEFL